MVLIGNNYVSKVLLDTADRLDIPIFCDERLKQTMGRPVHDISSLSEFAGRGACPPFYINAEECLPWVTGNFKDKRIQDAINLLKDKAEFRRVASSMYPDFYFRKLGMEELDSFKLPKGKSVVIKPSKGFFGIGVRKIKNEAEWKANAKEVLAEVKKNSKYFPGSILNDSVLLVEEFIRGEEYAVDMYYDSSNEPVIMDIYHHPYRDERDTRNVLYYSNPGIIRRLTPKAVRFFKLLSKQLDLGRIPIHAEFRETKSGELIPVEVNPCRFGGFGLADLTYYGYGFNPYEYFFTGKKPDWEGIMEKKRGLELGWVLANNPSIDLSKARPNHKKFKATFSDILHYDEMNYRKWPVFAVVYAQSRNLNEFLKYLRVDFADYFEKTPRTV
jgi:hypothetical protein